MIATETETQTYGDIRMEKIVGDYNAECNLRGCGCSIMCAIFVLLALGGVYNIGRLWLDMMGIRI